jgi:hypothetical protein
MSKIGTSQIELDSTKILREDDEEIVLPALLAREAVLSYAQGRAFRPREELKKSLFTFDGAWCVSKKHPDRMLVTDPREISGKVSNAEWDESRGLVKGHIHLFKPKNDPAFIQDVKEGRLKDVSIGFIYAEDWTPGEYQGQKYDFIQRNLLINHVAVGVPRGRMTSPQVGLGLDSTLNEVFEGDSFGDASFPDECFLWVPESAKGPDGNKSERKLPYKNKDGSVDLAHVRNALARLDQTTGIPSAEKDKIRRKLQDLIAKANPDYQPSTGGDSATGSSGSSQTSTQKQTDQGKQKKDIPSTADLIAKNKRVRELARAVL